MCGSAMPEYYLYLLLSVANKLPPIKTLLYVISDENYYSILILFELTCKTTLAGEPTIVKLCAVKHDQPGWSGQSLGYHWSVS